MRLDRVVPLTPGATDSYRMVFFHDEVPRFANQRVRVVEVHEQATGIGTPSDSPPNVPPASRPQQTSAENPDRPPSFRSERQRAERKPPQRSTDRPVCGQAQRVLAGDEIFGRSPAGNLVDSPNSRGRRKELRIISARLAFRLSRAPAEQFLRTTRAPRTESNHASAERQSIRPVGSAEEPKSAPTSNLPATDERSESAWQNRRIPRPNC